MLFHENLQKKKISQKGDFGDARSDEKQVYYLEWPYVKRVLFLYKGFNRWCIDNFWNVFLEWHAKET